ncbi:peptide deformylase [Zooshikella sp. RANM57]|uniref:peptide deformylase n=1 Tax=Zooshikella sp. RANM57 TaxID=3425863 RepID=UPI003D6F47EA
MSQGCIEQGVKSSKDTSQSNKPLFNHPELFTHTRSATQNKILRAENQPIRPEAIPFDLVDKMKRILEESGGIGIAAPQIGINKQAIIIVRTDKPDSPMQAYFNPRLTWVSKTLSKDYEGCLSVPDGVGLVERPSDITVRYLNELGEEHEETLSGIMARVFQHEIDHLNGILFIDKKLDQPLLSVEEYLKMKAEQK